jgi:hypothetical protein
MVILGCANLAYATRPNIQKQKILRRYTRKVSSGFKKTKNMEVVILIIVVAISGLVCYLKSRKFLISWFISSLIVPAFVLFSEFVMPYKGSGASLWPIAFIFGGVAGTVSGLIGASIGYAILKAGSPPREDDDSHTH